MRKSEKKIKKETKLEFQKEEKQKKNAQKKWQHYLVSLLLILTGIVFIVYTQIDISFICKLAAAIFAAAGVVSIISYIVRDVTTGYYRLDLVYGIVLAFLALLFYTKQDVFSTYLPVIAGLILFANGVVKLQHSIDMKRIDRKMKKVTEGWLVVMIFALMCIAAGAVIAYLTPTQDRKMFLIIGISFAVAGLSDVFTNMVFDRKVNEFNSGDYLKDLEEDAKSKEEKPATTETESYAQDYSYVDTAPYSDTVPYMETLPEAEPVPEAEPASEAEAVAEPAPEPEISSDAAAEPLIESEIQNETTDNIS